MKAMLGWAAVMFVSAGADVGLALWIGPTVLGGWEMLGSAVLCAVIGGLCVAQARQPTPAA